MQIRNETIEDHSAIDQIHERAFGGQAEAALVRAIRPTALASLVAVVDDAPVGHVLFSPLPLRRGAESIAAAALAPLAVLPEHQRCGAGSALTRAGLERLESCPVVIVLGDPAYYARFGFRPAAGFGVTGEYAGAGNAFMALELSAGALAGGGWQTQYPDAFHGV